MDPKQHCIIVFKKCLKNARRLRYLGLGAWVPSVPPPGGVGLGAWAPVPGLGCLGALGATAGGGGYTWVSRLGCLGILNAAPRGGLTNRDSLTKEVRTPHTPQATFVWGKTNNFYRKAKKTNRFLKKIAEIHRFSK